MGLIEQVLTFIGGGARAWPPPRLSLALQGGGSFGAFTAGVLDRLLDEPDVDFDAVSGASAGAVNAVLLASGLIEGRAPAKARREQFLETDEPVDGFSAEGLARLADERCALPAFAVAVALSVQPFQP